MPEVMVGLEILFISAGVLVLLVKLGSGLAHLSEGERALGASTLEAQLLETADRVLAVVRAHPEGIRLTEIGEALDLQWQTLIGPVNDLLEREEIRKADQRYYPR